MNLIFTNHAFDALDEAVAKMGNPKVFVLVDDNTFTQVLPLFKAESEAVKHAEVIITPPGDVNKTIEAAQDIWKQLSDKGATRSSVLVNIGGGMVTDLGGFVAATFKRGIRFINVPTSLLGAVDAAVGGKTGVNFAGLKNEVGAFVDADTVIVTTEFINTLPKQEVLSGYAEMLKHALLDDKATLASLFNYDITNARVQSDPDKLLSLVQTSIGVKSGIVESDPHEAGARKALNLGHTIGHAFESLAMERQSPIPHGYAVAWGLVAELILSNMKMGFPSDTLHQFASFVKDNYSTFAITCDDYPRLLELMSHDKKNASPDAINFTLLSDVGIAHIDQTATPDEIKAALDIFRDLC